MSWMLSPEGGGGGNLAARDEAVHAAVTSGLVPRHRLTEHLRQGSDSALTLVSAPAGFGKTTLLAECLASDPGSTGRLVAWVSLDQGDNAPATFWAYVLDRAAEGVPEIGGPRSSCLRRRNRHPSQPCSPPSSTTSVPSADDVVLVLDDYHVIELPRSTTASPSCSTTCPPQLHLVIATRADPPLPLARLRARGELVEIRAADLRFTAEEAAAYLNGAMGLESTARTSSKLEERTEGWIAALQLAALSMQGATTTPRTSSPSSPATTATSSTTSSRRCCSGSRPSVQAFLLRTAVLDRLSGPLCDAVTGQSGGKAVLEALERANLFLVPLDERRHWYRYHHLFADVLRARLRDEQPHLVPELHRRASRWYAEHGDRSAAIGHALAAGDRSGAADLIEAGVNG